MITSHSGHFETTTSDNFARLAQCARSKTDNPKVSRPIILICENVQNEPIHVKVTGHTDNMEISSSQKFQVK